MSDPQDQHIRAGLQLGALAVFGVCSFGAIWCFCGLGWAFALTASFAGLIYLIPDNKKKEKTT